MARRDAAKIAALPQRPATMAAWRDEGATFWDEVAKRKDALRTSGHTEPGKLATLYEEARAEKEELEARHDAEMRPVSLALATLYQMIPEVFEAAEVEMLTTRGGHTVSTSPDIIPTVIDNDALVAWAQANGYERKLTLYAATVKSIATERMRSGDEMPDGVNIQGTTKVNFKKVKA